MWPVRAQHSSLQGNGGVPEELQPPALCAFIVWLTVYRVADRKRVLVEMRFL